MSSEAKVALGVAVVVALVAVYAVLRAPSPRAELPPPPGSAPTNKQGDTPHGGTAVVQSDPGHVVKTDLRPRKFRDSVLSRIS